LAQGSHIGLSKGELLVVGYWFFFTQRPNVALQQFRDHYPFHHDENGLPGLLAQLRSMAAVIAEENIGACVRPGYEHLKER
jgi:hypothetical protein